MMFASFKYQKNIVNGGKANILTPCSTVQIVFFGGLFSWVYLLQNNNEQNFPENTLIQFFEQ